MTMGVFYYLCAVEFDWVTGDTGDVAHKSIAELFGCDYKTIQKAITVLIEAEVIRTKRKGVKWSDGSGKPNRYSHVFPPFTPAQKTGRGLPKKEEAPYPKSGQHSMSSSIQNNKGAAGRSGEGRTSAPLGGPQDPGTPEAPNPISRGDALSVLSRNGFTASYSEVAGGTWRKELQALGYVLA